MPQDLCDLNVLAWSQQQAELLRRMARGERVNDLDWEHVVEEIEDVGLSELHAVESYLDLILADLLKAHAWPDSQALSHWLVEVRTFQRNARRRFAPSMRQRIDGESIYRSAAEDTAVLNGGTAPVRWPDACPFSLDELLSDSPAALQARPVAVCLRES
jgi:hypothetical protein